MNLLQIGFVVLICAGLALWFAPQIMAWRDRIAKRVPDVLPVPSPSDPASASMQRVVSLIRIARELEEVGAKSAAGKIKAALSTVIEEDLLR